MVRRRSDDAELAKSMTITELQAKRDQVLQRVGLVRAQFGERSFEFSEASKALAVIDSEINKLSSAQTGTSASRASYATFNNS